ncbi:MAG TPA: hypothetical protein VE991_00380 [Acidimicrobiales bacterium]|nr:hypothetical protein [Acidimicrobiales bacterium]
MTQAPVRMLPNRPQGEGAKEWKGAPRGAHEWVSFPDPDEERTWLFDVTFLASGWTCIFGRGCQGVLTGPAPELVHGCCSYGAHLTGGKDARRVEAAARTLTDEQWQFRRQGQPKAGEKRLRIFSKGKDGAMQTRVVKDACIFLNRPDFPGGAGCALHRAALDRRQAPLELKPDVCWQLPLRREDEVADDGHVTSTIRQWDRRDWGDGGFEFHWWCTEEPDAFVGTRPVYEEMRDELVALVGNKTYKRLVRYIEARDSVLGAAEGAGPQVTVVPLPHPAVRRR